MTTPIPAASNPFASAYLGEQVLNDPTLLDMLAKNTNPAAVYEAVDAAFNVLQSNAVAERWHAFGEVLIAADAAQMSDEHLIAFGRKWAMEKPRGEVFPSQSVLDMFAPHLRATGRIDG